MKIVYEPWQYLYIDDYLPNDEFMHHVEVAQKIQSDPSKVVRQLLDYDPMPNIINLLDEFAIHRQAKSHKKFIHYAVTPENFNHAKHVDAPFKIMSAVLYLAPTVNYGTTIYKHPDQLAVAHVKWKPNRLFVFCGLDNTWHDYKSLDTRYTLNYFIVDPDAIQNPEYKQGVI